MPPTKSNAKRTVKSSITRWIEKSGMEDHIEKEEGNPLPLWDEVKIIHREEHWRIRHLKWSAHMLGYSDLLSRPSIGINTM